MIYVIRTLTAAVALFLFFGGLLLALSGHGNAIAFAGGVASFFGVWTGMKLVGAW